MTARFAWRKDGGGIGGVDQVQKKRIPRAWHGQAEWRLANCAAPHSRPRSIADLKISRRSTPFGVRTSTISPSAAFKSALATGEIQLTSLSSERASSIPTIRTVLTWCRALRSSTVAEMDPLPIYFARRIDSFGDFRSFAEEVAFFRRSPAGAASCRRYRAPIFPTGRPCPLPRTPSRRFGTIDFLPIGQTRPRALKAFGRDVIFGSGRMCRKLVLDIGFDPGFLDESLLMAPIVIEIARQGQARSWQAVDDQLARSGDPAPRERHHFGGGSGRRHSRLRFNRGPGRDGILPLADGVARLRAAVRGFVAPWPRGNLGGCGAVVSVGGKRRVSGFEFRPAFRPIAGQSEEVSCGFAGSGAAVATVRGRPAWGFGLEQRWWPCWSRAALAAATLLAFL